MDDPRGILEEFVRSCDGYRDCRDKRYEGVSANLDPESRRIAYREKQMRLGLCIYCPRPADPRTMKKTRKIKVCTWHLQRDSERYHARKRRKALRVQGETKEDT